MTASPSLDQLDLPELQIAFDESVPGLLWLTLDRQSHRNAWSDEMLASVQTALDLIEEDDRVRVVALTGAGRAFSAGGDLKAMRDRAGMFEGDALHLRNRYRRGIQAIPRRLGRFDKPIIAAMNGPAIGAGLDLACMCDIRVAVERARFGSTFVKVGLIPGDGGAYLLARTIGFPRALEMVLTGRLVDAQEALRIGLVHEVVGAEELRAAVQRHAARLASVAPQALQLAKAACYRSWDLPQEMALELAATYQGIVQNTEDHLEGVASILEKRPAQFEGR